MSRLRSISPVWLLSGAVAVAAALGVPSVIDFDPPVDTPRLSWPVVALGFYLAEIAVLHLRFRRDAQSFSMNEIAITVGLFFAAPFDLIVGQLLGITAALIINRRQPVMKLVFNLAQFTAVTVVALAVFHWLVGTDDPLGPRSWLAVLAANFAGFVVGDVCVNGAIRLSGGSLSRRELWNVRWLTLVAAFMNTILGIVIVLVWSTRPAAVVLALTPPVMLYLAYLAYTSQRAQQARVEALQTTAQALLRSRSLDDVVGVAADQVRQMFEAERAEVAVFPIEGRPGVRGISRVDGVDVARPETTAGSIAGGESFLLRGSALMPYLTAPTVEPEIGMVTAIDGDSGPIGYVVVVNALSDVATFDQADLSLLETLSGQIGSIVENERLGGEVAALSQLVESRNEVLAAVSHEVRSPLATVVSAAGTLKSRMTDLSPENRLLLVDMISKNGQELTELVDDLLVAARGDSTTESIETQPADPATEVAGVVSSLVELDGSTRLEGDAPLVAVDPTRLRQIVRNLLTNAVRYGGDEVWLELAELDDDRVTIAVCDSGPGVPAHLASNIFDPYVSAHANKDRPQALGLGLAISRRLARLMGGDVTYERSEGVTRFVITLLKAH